MLPAIANLSKSIKKSDKKNRAKQIAELINKSAYDIIVFQEAFHIPARKILNKLLRNKYPFQYGPINRSFIKTNSGIFIVSKIKLTELATIKYKDCKDIDCFAKKGAGIFEGKHNGKVFQIVGTHLDSGSQKVREKQYKQAYLELLKKYEKVGVPQFFCGDLNTRINNKENYNKMLNYLNAEDIETNSSQTSTYLGRQIILDYILLRRNNSDVKIIDKSIKIFKAKEPMTEILKGTLSDHLAVELTFRL